jgi:uncharacterized protein
MVYLISPFVKVIESEQYVALFNFYNDSMAIFYTVPELPIIRAVINGEDIDGNETIERLRKGLYITDNREAMYKLVNMEYDEECYQSHRLTITIMVGEACNFRCKYCYEDYDAHILETEKLSGVITFICDYVKQHSVEDVTISWFGGEPTLYKEAAIDFMSNLRNALSDAVNVRGFMTTNGYLLEASDFRSYYNAGITGYQITLDGFSETHDSMRVLRTGEPTWTKIIDNLRSIHSMQYDDASVLLRINYNENVLEKACEFIDFIKTTFNNEFTVHAHPISQMGGDGNEYLCDLNTRLEAEKMIGNFILDNGVRSDFSTLRTQKFRGVCYASKPNEFLIDPYGCIRKCTVHLKADYNIVGRIIDDRTYEIDKAALAQWIKTTLNDPECENCCVYPVCMQRGCTAAIFNGGNECGYVKAAIFSYLQHMADIAYTRVQQSLQQTSEV